MHHDPVSVAGNVEDQAIERQFIVDGPSSAWTICVGFDDNGVTAVTRPGIG